MKSRSSGTGSNRGRTGSSLFFNLQWKFFSAAVLVTALVPLVLHIRVSTDRNPTTTSSNTDDRPYHFIIPLKQQHQQRSESEQSAASQRRITTTTKKTTRSRFARDPSLKVDTSTSYEKIINIANQAENEIINFFHGEPRALRDGIPYGGGGDDSEESNNKLLTKRLIHRIRKCEQQHNAENNNDDHEDCIFKVVFIGSGQTTGRDNFYNDTYPFATKDRIEAVVQAAGLRLQLYNHAMDSDLSREGPQSTHLCIANFVGPQVDVIVWDLDGNMQASPSAQIEAFVRWSITMGSSTSSESASSQQQQPAMIIMNRGGPHGLSRRGKSRLVVNLGPGHDAMVYEDHPKPQLTTKKKSNNNDNNSNDDELPKQRQESYRTSSTFKNRWQKGRNTFWESILESYSPFVDIATVDPQGSIWHLDHLLEFSNQAFDAGKALPLVDCGPKHEPPCNQIPEFIHTHIQRGNLTVDNIPPEEIGQGAFCMSQLGCRHLWYGGKRSHILRGELNALPILRAIRDAARALQRDYDDSKNNNQHNKDKDNKSQQQQEDQQQQQQQRSLTSMSSLPPPEFCKDFFCNKVPKCMTSYVPNLGLDLGHAIVTPTTREAEAKAEGNNEVVRRPRKGACHFLDDPIKQIKNLDLRFSPLGYIDRKFGYRIAVNAKPKKKKKKMLNEEDLDASSMTVSFTTTGPGPLIVCEPPCFIDTCSKNRMKPFNDYVQLELDGKKIDTSAKVPHAVEVGGPFCKVIAGSVEKGDHSLRITTDVVSPQYVMISAVIPFSS